MKSEAPDFIRVHPYKELSDASAEFTLNSRKQELPAEIAIKVADYLDQGETIAVMGGRDGCDVISKSDERCVRTGLATDGRFIWDRGLAYYVRKYAVWVPDALVEAALTNGKLAVSPERVAAAINFAFSP